MKIAVRKATIKDLPVIQKLSVGLFTSDGHRDKWLNHNWSLGKDGKKYFSKRITKPDCVCLVVEADDNVVGYLAGEVRKVDSWRPVKKTELENIFVEEKFRGKGLGKGLVNGFLKWSHEKGVDRAMVCAYASNEQAIKFYQREQFSPYSLTLEVGVAEKKDK